MSRMMRMKGFGEALHEVTEWLMANVDRLDRLTDAELAQRIEAAGMDVRAHDAAGDAEKCHEASKITAGLALYSMARGLS